MTDDAYEILDRDSGNLVATFPSEEATRAAVRAAIHDGGSYQIASWLVGRIDYEGPVLEGNTLFAWALEAPVATETER